MNTTDPTATPTPITSKYAGIAASHPHFSPMIGDMAHLERELAASREECEQLRKNYYAIADAVAPSSDSTEHLCQQARNLHAQNAKLEKAEGDTGRLYILVARAKGALMAANADCLADRKAEDDRRSESGSPGVDWPKETPYESIIRDLDAARTVGPTNIQLPTP